MKRASESQLTKDNVDSAEENDNPIRDSKGFDRAPPEVMATRRILKVRRTLSSAPPEVKARNPFAFPGAGNDSGNDGPHTDGNAAVSDSAGSPPKDANPFAALSASANKSPSAKKIRPTIDAPPTPEKPDTHAPDFSEPQSDASPSATKAANSANETFAENRFEPITTVKIETGTTKEVISKAKCEGKPGKGEDHNEEISKTGDDVPNDKEGSNQKPFSARDDSVVKSMEANLGSGIENDLNGHTTSESKKSPSVDQQVSALEAEAKPAVDISGGETHTEVENVVKENNENTAKEGGAAVGQKKSSFGVFSGGVTFGTQDKSTPLLSFASAAKGEEGKLSFNTASSATNLDEGKLKDTVTEQKEFKEEKVETGEEGEIELFRTRAKLYCLEQGDVGARWKERGVGQLKLKENGDKGRVRLIMRTEATLRVILNCAIYDNTKLEKASDRSVRFSAIEAGDNEENKARCFLVRFSTKEVTSSFVATVEKCKKDLADRPSSE